MTPLNRSISERSKIDRALQTFREAWAIGSRPRLSDYLEEFSEESAADRRRALYRLVLLEIDLRRQQGDSVDLAHYQLRFPELAADEFADLAVLPLPSFSHSPPLLPNRYRPLQVVGQGGLGIVWRVSDENLDRLLAVKIPRDELQWDAETNARLRREAVITGGLQHPGIPPVVECGQLVTGVTYFSMKLVEGQTLSQLISKRTGVERQRTALLEVLLQVSDAVAYAHAQGFIHCDLKPHNVMVGKFGEVQLMDWGMARAYREGATLLPSGGVDRASSAPNHSANTKTIQATQADTAPGQNDDSRTRAGQVMGSPAYMAPEQARGDRHITDPRTDVYALAAILYELLTGRPPAEGGSSEETLESARRGLPAPVRQLQPKTPPDLEAICMKGLAYEPADRYASAEEFSEDLRRWLRGLPIQARQHSWLAHTGKWVRRRPAIAALGLVSLLALAGLSTLGVVSLFYQQLRTAHSQTVVQKRRAEKYLVTANEMTVKAQNEESNARTAERLTRRVVYAADMDRIDQALQEGDVGLALQLLDRHKPDESASEEQGEDLRGFEWYYLKRRCQTAELTIKMPGVTAAVLVNGDEEILAGNRIGEIIRLDARTGEVLGKLEFERPPALMRAWLKAMVLHERTLLGVQFEGGVLVLDLRTGAVLLHRDVAYLTSLCFSPSGREVAWVERDRPDDPRIKLANLANGQLQDVILPEAGPNAVAFASDDELVIGDESGNLWRFQTNGAQLGEPFQNSNSQIERILCNPSQGLLAVACQANVTIRRLSDLEMLHQLRFEVNEYQQNTAMCLAARGSGRVAFADGHRWVDWEFGRPRESKRVYVGHFSDIDSGCYGRGLVRTVTTSSDGTIRVWNPTWNPPAETQFFEGTVGYPCGFDQAGKSLLMVSFQSHLTIALLDIETGEERASIEIPPERLQNRQGPNVILHPAGNQVAIAGVNGEVLIWDVEEPAVDGDGATASDTLTTLIDEGGEPFQLKYSPSGRLLAVPYRDGSIRFWDVEQKSWTRVFDFDGKLAAIAISPDDRFLVCGVQSSASSNGVEQRKFQIQVWEIETGRQIHVLNSSLDSVYAHLGVTYKMEIDPKGRLLVVGFNLELWDLASGNLLGRGERLSLRERNILAIKFSEVGDRVFLGTAAGTCEVWDVETVRKLMTLRDTRLYTRRFSNLGLDQRGVLLSSGQPAVQRWDGTPE